MKTGFYKFCRVLLYLYFPIFCPIRAIGLEKVPKDQPVIFCFNHVSLIDPVAAAFVVRRPLHFMAKIELFSNKALSWLITSLGAIPVKRGGADLGAVRACLSVLSKGEALGIFPQGTRDPAHEKSMETGVALLAQRSQATVVPALIPAPFRLFHKNVIIFGDPISMEQFGKKSDAQTLALVTKRIEDGIWSLTPAAQRTGR